MYSSPATPGSTGCRSASRTWIVVLATGAQSVSTPPAPIRAVLDQTVVSVGPYMSQPTTPVSASHTARSGGSFSPPQSASSRAGGYHSVSRSIRQVAGVAWNAVTPSAANRAASASASTAWDLSASTTVAPRVSG